MSFSRFFSCHRLAPPYQGRHWEGTSLALSEVELMRRSWYDGKSTKLGEGTWVLGPALLVTDWMTEYSSP